MVILPATIKTEIVILADDDDDDNPNVCNLSGYSSAGDKVNCVEIDQLIVLKL